MRIMLVHLPKTAPGRVIFPGQKARPGRDLPPELLSRTLGHGANFSDYLTLAWLLASSATIGGALGSGLEDNAAAVTEAAYGVRQRQRIEETQNRSNEAE